MLSGTGWRVLVGLGVMALALAACGEAGSPADDPVPVTFTIGFIPTPVHAAWYVGVDKGFYADEGLDVEVQPGESSHATVTALASGAADFGSVDLSSLAFAKAEDPDLPVVAVAPVYARAPYAIYSLASGANVGTPEDLDGVMIGVTGTSTLDDLLTVWGERQGVTGFTFQSINPATSQQLLVSGDIPATVAFIIQQPALAPAAAEAGEELVVLNLAEWGLDDFYGLVVGASQAFVDDQPDAARAFVRASVRAWEYTLKHPEEAAEIMNGRFPTMDPGAIEATLALAAPLVTDGGQADIGVWQPHKVESTLGYLGQESVDPEQVYTVEFTAR